MQKILEYLKTIPKEYEIGIERLSGDFWALKLRVSVTKVGSDRKYYYVIDISDILSTNFDPEDTIISTIKNGIFVLNETKNGFNLFGGD